MATPLTGPTVVDLHATKMTSCLVPDFPAVMVALEHIKELDKQLKEEGVPFFTEASLHLSELAVAISELEGDRRATHEHLEVETIENSKLRHQINNTRERISQEIEADIAAARASNADEIEQLHQDLNTVSQLQEKTMERQEVLLRQNEELHPERGKAKAEHEEVIAALNEQMILKYSLQSHLDQTHGQIEELKSAIAALKQDRITVLHNMVLEREAFYVKKDSLWKEESHVGEKIQQQEEIVGGCRNDLNKVNGRKMEAKTLLGELTNEVEKLESNIQRLTESRCQRSRQLEEEMQQHRGLKQEKETLKKKLSEIKEAHSVALQSLKEKIGTVEGRIDEARSSRLNYQDSLAQTLEILKCQQDEEKEVREEHFNVSQQLQRSKQQLQERIAAIVKHSKEINEMDKQIRELVEDHAINRQTFESDEEEMISNVDTEKKNICHFEEEKRRLTELLEEENRRQEEHKKKMADEICSTKRRYEELLQEKAMLHQSQPNSVDANLMVSYTQQRDDNYKRQESKCHEEIEQCVAEAKMVIRNITEKQNELEDEEAKLKEVEEKWREAKSRFQQLEMLTSELSRKKSHLELMIDDLKERTAALLQPKEEMKARLEELRKSHALQEQAAELRAVEMSIYDNTVKLEQVGMENSRLHLCIRQMTEGVDRTRQDTKRYNEEARQLLQEAASLFGKLQGGWREDLSVTQDCQREDGVLLVSLSALLEHLNCRTQQLGAVSTLLQQQVFNCSRRLGDKATAGK